MNILKLMKNAGKLQEMMQQQQQDIANTIVVGESGAGMVTAQVNGKYHVLNLNIDDSLFTDKAMLIELVIAAINNANEKVSGLVQEKMMNASKILGGDLGGMFGSEGEEK